LNQIIVNLDAQLVSSPDAAVSEKWESKLEGWTSGRVHSLFVAVYLSDGLLEAAVDYWAADGDITPSQRASKISELRQLYAPPGKKTFLLVLRPFIDGNYPDWWRMSIGRNADSVYVHTMDGAKGRLLSYEPVLDFKIDSANKVIESVLVFEDTFSNKKLPIFNVVLQNIRHDVRSTSRAWITSRTQTKVAFRFELNEVQIARMVSNGIPWNVIESKYLRPRRDVLAAQFNDKTMDFILNVVTGVVTKVLLRI
jgi:hypothetical protein